MIKDASGNQVLDLPQGGGAVAPTGEKFSPTLQTGTGNFSIPLPSLPGRGGMSVAMALVYSTGQGNGPFGLGWALDVPGVMRSSSRGLPTYNNTKDTFVLSGAEDLVLVGEVVQDGVSYKSFRPRTEGLFARILFRDDPINSYWMVDRGDGRRSFYGTPTPSATQGWRDPAALSDPANPSKILEWKLSLTRDSFGNEVHYQWEADLTGDATWLYLTHVKWCEFGAASFLAHIYLDYETRPDPFSKFRNGFEQRCTKRLTRVETRSQTLEADSARIAQTLCKSLDVTYGLAPSNKVSLLNQALITGYDGAQSESFPPTSFEYSSFEPGSQKFEPVQGPLPAFDANTTFADISGNGISDIVRMDGRQAQWWKNLGGLKFASPRRFDAPDLPLSSPAVSLLDVDGDGNLDLMVQLSNVQGYFPMLPDGTWDTRSFHTFDKAPSFAPQDPELRFIDLNGDGAMDALRTGSAFECLFQQRTSEAIGVKAPGWTSTRVIKRKSAASFPDVNFSDPRVRLADMTGDGLADIVMIHRNRVDYWPNLGFGDFGARRTLNPGPNLPREYNPASVHLADVDGDGCDDLVFVDGSKVVVWFNQSGNGFSEPVEILGTPRAILGVHFLDLKGSGTTGVLFQLTPASNKQRWYFLDLTGGVKPYLMQTVDTHRGAITHVVYRSSVVDALRDDLSPDTRWKTRLPFPNLVVSKTESIDQISLTKLTTEFKYHHGYWDGRDREFRGFGMVETLDTETFIASQSDSSGVHEVLLDDFAPPRLLKSWFDLGPVGDPYGKWDRLDFANEYWAADTQKLGALAQDLPEVSNPTLRRQAIRARRGQILRSELYGLDGSALETRPYTVTETLTHSRLETLADATDPNQWPVVFAYGVAARTTEWDRGTDPMHAFSFTENYESYGHAQTTTQVGVPRGRDPLGTTGGDAFLITTSNVSFTQQDDVSDGSKTYLHGLAYRTVTQEIPNDGDVVNGSIFDVYSAILDLSAPRVLIAESAAFFDGNAFEGLPLGTVGNHGILSRTDGLVLTDDILAEAYPNTTLEPDFGPPVWLTSDTPTFDGETPAGFVDDVPLRGGYVIRSGETLSDGYWTTSGFGYDVQVGPTSKGLLIQTKDALGALASVTWDSFDLLPVQTTDPLGNTTSVSYDYRVFAPSESVDSNLNITRYTYDPRGLLTSVARHGKDLTQPSPSEPASTWFDPMVALSPLSLWVADKSTCFTDSNTTTAIDADNTFGLVGSITDLGSANVSLKEPQKFRQPVWRGDCIEVSNPAGDPTERYIGHTNVGPLVGLVDSREYSFHFAMKNLGAATWSRYLYATHTTVGLKGFSCQIKSNGAVWFWIGDANAASRKYIETAAGVVADGKDAIITVTGDGTDVRIYVNGTLVLTSSFPAGAPTPGNLHTNHVMFINPNNAIGVTGDFESMGIWSRCLTPAEVQTVAACRPPRYTAKVSPWDKLDVDSEDVLLVPEGLSNFSVGDPVSVWVGLTRQRAKNTAAIGQPTKQLDNAGVPCVRFDGTNDVLTCHRTLWAQPFSVATRVKFSATTDQTVWASGGSTETTVVRTSTGLTVNSGTALSVTKTWDTNPHVLMGVANGAQSVAQVDLDSIVGAAGAGDLNPGGLRIGLKSDTTAPLNADVTVVYGRKRAWTAAERANIPAQIEEGTLPLPTFEGDPLGMPSQRFSYDLEAWDRESAPLSSTTYADTKHDGTGETLRTTEYADGMGRVIQTRVLAPDTIYGGTTLGSFGHSGLNPDLTASVGAAQATTRSGLDPDHVVVNGWTVFDNKGQPIRQYEPFYDTGWDWSAPDTAQPAGSVFAQMKYDARGRAVRTIRPDDAEQRVIFGVPGTIVAPDLTSLDVFEPTPWESYAYSANDLSGLTHPTTTTGYSVHRYTPANSEIDALGRTVRTVERNQTVGGGMIVLDEHVTTTVYDIRGNVLSLTDPLGRVAATQVYDLANRTLRSNSIDQGSGWMAFDVRNLMRESRDEAGARSFAADDIAGRPLFLWGKDDAASAVTLRQRMLYGEDVIQPEAQNLRGQLFASYDETGRSEFAYDFKGLTTHTRKRFVDPALLIAHLSAQNTAGNGYAISAYKVDWSGSLELRESALLELAEHVTTQSYDALGRVTQMVYPRDVKGVRQVLEPSYNRAGALESATIDGQTRVENIAYNARGQRILLALGNGVVTRYAYDPQNFRLRRMRAETCSKSGTTYTPLGTVFEDCGYHDDLDGNILGLIDKSSEGAAIASRFAQPSTLQGYGFSLPTDAQIRQYTYDPLGRVLSSQGFEHVNRSPSAPWDDTVTAQLSDPNDVRAFNETYSYDKTSGLQSLSHTPSEGTSGYTRNYSFASGSNRLASMTVGGTTYNYVYGPTGCMTKENTERHYVWDAARRLSLFKVQVSGSAATKIGQYLYDGSGERRLKIKSTTGRHEITYYLGAFELTRLIRTGQAEASNSLAFIHDAGTAIFRGRSGDVLPGESSRPAEQYTLSDHLGSAATTVDDTGAKISREAYTAYGESTYGSFEKKRYRFTGKERDEESGLNYHSARYYAPWLGRWLSPDPSGFVDGPNLYAYVRGNPVNLNDPTGNQGNTPLESDDGFKGGGGGSSAQITTGSDQVGTEALNPDYQIIGGQLVFSPTPLKEIGGVRVDGQASIGMDQGNGVSVAQYEQNKAYKQETLAALAVSPGAAIAYRIALIFGGDADLAARLGMGIDGILLSAGTVKASRTKPISRMKAETIEDTVHHGRAGLRVIMEQPYPHIASAKVRLTPEAAHEAFQGMNRNGGHAMIRPMSEDWGHMVKNTGSQARKIAEFESIFSRFLTDPEISVPYRISGKQGHIFTGTIDHKVDGVRVVENYGVWVITEGKFAGKVSSVIKFDKTQWEIMQTRKTGNQ